MAWSNDPHQEHTVTPAINEVEAALLRDVLTRRQPVDIAAHLAAAARTTGDNPDA